MSAPKDSTRSETGDLPKGGPPLNDAQKATLDRLRDLPVRDMGKPATEQQKRYIVMLLKSRAVNHQVAGKLTAELETMSTGRAHRTITYLRTLPLQINTWPKGFN